MSGTAAAHTLSLFLSACLHLMCVHMQVSSWQTPLERHNQNQGGAARRTRLAQLVASEKQGEAQKTSRCIFRNIFYTVFTRRLECMFTPVTSSVVTVDCVSQKTCWYFHRTTVKQGAV